MPLGDLARMARKKSPPSQDVIDNDNLPKVMEQAESRHAFDAALRFSMEGTRKSFQVSSPDVTCSLSFSANAKALLSRQYEQLELPANEIAKLSGPATIEGESLAISLFNGTDWHVSELAVALTIVKRPGTPDTNSFLFTGQAPVPAAQPPLVSEIQSRKTSDQALLYRLRQSAPPGSVTVFSIPLNFEMVPDQEWHWAIVQARGYPPSPPNQQTLSTAQVPVVQPAPILEPTSSPVPPLIPTSLNADVPAHTDPPAR